MRLSRSKRNLVTYGLLFTFLCFFISSVIYLVLAIRTGPYYFIPAHMSGISSVLFFVCFAISDHEKRCHDNDEQDKPPKSPDEN